MKKSYSVFFVVLFLFSLSAFAQTIGTNARVVGAGTNISVPVYFYGDPVSLKGFELTINNNSCFTPITFQLGYILYNQNWSCVSDIIYPEQTNNNMQLRVAAVGNNIYLYNQQEIGSIKFYVSENLSGNFFPPSIRLFDGKITYATGASQFKIINLPFNNYGDLNNDGKRDINDNIISFDLIGTITNNDTLSVSNDLDGDGLNTSYDTYLGLIITVNPLNIYICPIFRNYTSGYGSVIPTTPVITEWKKLSNNKYGLFSKEKVTNGDITGEDLSSLQSTGAWFKKEANNKKAYFLNPNSSADSPILISDFPVQLSGKVNNGRKIIVSSMTTGVEETSNVPTQFKLLQNYPNPFNPTTTISYALPSSGLVTLKVYNLLGEEVAELVNEQKTAGNYEVKFDASKLASGMYMYQLIAGNTSQVRKMILMK